MRRLWHAETWTAIFTGVLAAVTAGALWYAHSQIKEAHEEAQVQHLMSLVAQFDDEPMATYRKTLAEDRLQNKQDPAELYRVLDFFETVGVLTDRGYLNEDDVWNEFGYWVLHLYADDEVQRDVNYEMNHQANEYHGFMSLLDRMNRIEKEHGGKSFRDLSQEVNQFYKEESHILAGSPTLAHRHAVSP
jgi:hypothetical protein